MPDSSFRTKGKTLSLGKMELNTEPNLNTKKRHQKPKHQTYDSSKDSLTTIEHKLEKDPFQIIEPSTPMSSLEEMRKRKKNEVPIRYEVSCLAATDEMVFMGLEDQLGVLINNNKSNKRQVRFPHSDNLRQITCI